MALRKYFHQARRFLAKIWLEINLQLTVVGVTGSYGKTSTTRAIAEVLSAKYSVNKTDLNLDTIYNLPITILKTKPWDEVLVLEYGVDHVGEMDFHLSLVQPKIAILTGVTSVHTDKEHLQSIDKAIAEKRKLVEAISSDGLGIFNFDDLNSRQIGKEFSKRKVFYGLDKRADIWADKIEINLSGTKFKLYDGKKQTVVETGLLGYPAVYSCLAAYIVGKELKVDEGKILQKLRFLVPLSGRFSIEAGPLGTILVNDSRRANVVSTISGLKSFAEFPGRKIAVLGEMGEIGEQEKSLHSLVGKEIAKLPIDFVIGVGPLTRFLVEEAEKDKFPSFRLFWVEDVQTAADILKKILKPGDLLYLKASLLRHLERIILLLSDRPVKCRQVVCNYYQPCTTCRNFYK